MALFSSLNREEKQTIGLLQVGTFLEYFDLMLYVHMAVLLNELFFPQSDAYSASLLTAFALCSSLAFRPIGALFFGWLGDRVGRKPTIIVTTGIMATSCLVMANVPTYAQIGILAAWIVTICRVLQGISSIGELVGAKIYLTETFRRPKSYPIVATISIFSTLGGVAALGVATLVTSSGFNWRLAFWAGAVIALVTAVSRKRLRETPEFIAAHRKWLKEGIYQSNYEFDPVEAEKIRTTWKEPVNKTAVLSYFALLCGWPLCFYLVYLYFIPFLKKNFGYSASDIIKHNFLLSLFAIVVYISFTYLSSRVHPLRILKARGVSFFFVMVFFPFLIPNLTSPIQVYLIQALIMSVSITTMPADPVFLSYLPLYRRVTYGTFLFAISRALVFIITSFGLVYLSDHFGHSGIYLISMPITFFFLVGLLYFEKLEYNYARIHTRNRHSLLEPLKVSYPPIKMKV